ncbi:hypothetical protein R50073_24340 [Maricurvus nonylphenolicus]|uniref:phage antirepressor KilAC domain-containing protein n=1 Tax=Maricurvus nonylphenolicus TaxID=1008307 RepID=UPI0036F1CC2F
MVNSVQNPNPNQPMPIADAARILGVGSKTLFAKLREKQVLGPNNVAMPPYVHHRLFVIHNRRFRKSGTNVRQWYQVSLVTPKGLSWLEEKLTHWQPESTKQKAS